MIVLKHVTKRIGKRDVLADVSLRIDPGECVCIVGRSGVGKSALLRLLIGADNATKGTVSVDGVDLRAVPTPALRLYRRRVGMLFQDELLLPRRTVEENVALPLEVCGFPDLLIKKRVPALLERLGLLGKRAALPGDLSALERVKAAVARAIIGKPLILLADDPTGSLDADQATEIVALLADIHAMGTTVIVATRDTAVAEALHARSVRMENGSIVSDDGAENTAAQTTEAAKKNVTKSATTATASELPFSEKRAEPRRSGMTVAERGERKKVRITSIGSM